MTWHSSENGYGISSSRFRSDFSNGVLICSTIMLTLLLCMCLVFSWQNEGCGSRRCKAKLIPGRHWQPPSRCHTLAFFTITTIRYLLQQPWFQNAICKRLWPQKKSVNATALNGLNASLFFAWRNKSRYILTNYQTPSSGTIICSWLTKTCRSLWCEQHTTFLEHCKVFTGARDQSSPKRERRITISLLAT